MDRGGGQVGGRGQHVGERVDVLSSRGLCVPAAAAVAAVIRRVGRGLGGVGRTEVAEVVVVDAVPVGVAVGATMGRRRGAVAVAGAVTVTVAVAVTVTVETLRVGGVTVGSGDIRSVMVVVGGSKVAEIVIVTRRRSGIVVPAVAVAMSRVRMLSCSNRRSSNSRRRSGSGSGRRSRRSAGGEDGRKRVNSGRRSRRHVCNRSYSVVACTHHSHCSCCRNRLLLLLLLLLRGGKGHGLNLRELQLEPLLELRDLVRRVRARLERELVHHDCVLLHHLHQRVASSVGQAGRKRGAAGKRHCGSIAKTRAQKRGGRRTDGWEKRDTWRGYSTGQSCF